MRARYNGFRVTVGAALVALACGSAAAQCTPAWHAAGMGISGTVHDLEIWNDGSGPALYAGGVAGTGFVRQFDGNGWALIGPNPPEFLVTELAGSDWGGEPRLFVSGRYGILGPHPIAYQWDGTIWSGVGPAEFNSCANCPRVSDMAIARVGNQDCLFVSTAWSSGGIFSSGTVYRWDGSQLSTVFHVSGNKQNHVGVYALSAGWEPAEPGVFIGGSYSVTPPGVRAIARWNQGLFQVGGIAANHPIFVVYHAAALDLGRGTALYISGYIPQIGTLAAGNVAEWDGVAWTPLGQLASPGCVTTFDDGTGAALHAAHGDLFSSSVSKWNGVAWSALGSPFSGAIYSFKSFDDDGPGPNPAGLYAGGALGVRVWGCPAPCYPDCDASGGLTIADFTCFQARFAAGEPYADCNASGVLTVGDFACFQTRFVTGCP